MLRDLTYGRMKGGVILGSLEKAFRRHLSSLRAIGVINKVVNDRPINTPSSVLGIYP